MKNRLLLFLIIVCQSIVLIAQSSASSSGESYKNKTFDSSELTLGNFFQTQGEFMGLSSADEMVLYRSYIDKNQIIHHRYHQYHNGVKVYGETYILHEKEGLIYRSTGQFAPNIQLKKEHLISEDQAIKYAKQYFYNLETKRQYELQNIENAIVESIEKIIIDYRFPKHRGIYKSAYLIKLQDKDNYLKKEAIIVDESSGNMIFRQPLIIQHNVPSTGQTRFYGEQSFTSDSISPNHFILRDNERNIQTFNEINFGVETITDDSSYWDLGIENQHAIDAHYATTVFHDMMRDTCNWLGIDGNGNPMKASINIFGGGDFLNAFWDEGFARFGNGDCHHGPLTTLSIVGHEFMHGITEHTSGLIYNSESGAINEAMSDIFGKASEYYNDNEHFSWLLGPEPLSPFAVVFRSMSNPNEKGDPKFYRGEYWGDFANIHINSGVLNYWFYLMIEGGIQTNEEGESFDITPVRMANVLQILFNCQTSYLTESSSYQDLYDVSKIATEELYGIDSDEYTSLIKAWGMVGLPNTEASLLMTDLAIRIQQDTLLLCSTEEFIDLTIRLSNTGESIIPMGELLHLNIQYGDSIVDLEITLEEDFILGEDLVYNFTDLMVTNPERPSFVIFVRLLSNDNNSSNNFDFAIQDVLFYDEPEININLVSINRENCLDNQLFMRLQLQNISCETLATGQVFDFVIHYPTSEVNFSYALPYDKEPGSIILITRMIPFPDRDEVGEYFIEFTTDSDQNLANNKEIIEMPKEGALKEEYLYTFDDDSFRNDFLQAFGLENAVYNYNNENYLATTSTFTALIDGSCSDVSSNFIGYSPSLESCVDLSDFANPYIEFDMLQFRNNETADAYPELSQYTSILKVNASSNGNIIEEYIYNQEEGETVHHRIDLPPYFNGRIQMETHNQKGNLDSLEESIALYDVILLDNLRVGNDQTIDVEDIPELEKDIFLYPNPTSGKLHISSDKKIAVISLFNSQGTVVQTIQLNGSSIESQKYSLDTSSLPSGIYFVQLKLKNSSVVTKRFLKF